MLARSLIKTPNDAITNEKPEANRTSEIKIIGKKIIEKFKVGDIIKDAVVKGYSSVGCFFEVNNEIDVLVHLQEISYWRVNHPDEIFNIGEKHD